MLGLCVKLPICLFGHTMDTSIILKKAKVSYFIDIQPRKMKFTFVQINMKQVSYSFRNYIRMSKSLDPDQAQHFVGPDLGPYCLQRLPANDKFRH